MFGGWKVTFISMLWIKTLIMKTSFLQVSSTSGVFSFSEFLKTFGEKTQVYFAIRPFPHKALLLNLLCAYLYNPQAFKCSSLGSAPECLTWHGSKYFHTWVPPKRKRCSIPYAYEFSGQIWGMELNDDKFWRVSFY